MDIVIFRQERVEHAADLWAEVQKGRLRQGWSFAAGLSLEETRRDWLRAFREAASGEEDPEQVLFKTWGMKKIKPGTLIVVPHQPTADEFLVMQSVRAPGTGKFPCYRFVAPMKDTGDFRHCVYIDPKTVRRAPNASLTGEALDAVTGSAFQSPVQFVNMAKYRKALLSVAASLGTAPLNALEGASAAVTDTFTPKHDRDYKVNVKGGTRVQTRRHETLVAAFAKYLGSRGAGGISTPHPVDLRMKEPATVLFEMKAVKRNACPAVREAIGQLFWYRFREGPPDAALCVVLDQPPPAELVRYVERGVVGVMICWYVKGKLGMGPTTAAQFRRWKLV